MPKLETVINKFSLFVVPVLYTILALHCYTIPAQLMAIILMIPYFIINRHKYAQFNWQTLWGMGLLFVFMLGLHTLFITMLLGCSIHFVHIAIQRFLITVVFAPICEEMYFRGVVMDHVERVPVVLRCIVVGLFFGLIHNIFCLHTPLSILLIAIGGTIMSFIRIKTNSLPTSMTFHATWNMLLSMFVVF